MHGSRKEAINVLICRLDARECSKSKKVYKTWDQSVQQGCKL